MSAVVFLVKQVLNKDPVIFGGIIRAKRTRKLPTVLTRDEVKSLISRLTGDKWIMANLLYGVGLRLMECLRLRVKNIDFNYRQISVRDGKGEKDRVSMPPTCVITPLKAHLAKIRALHRKDLGAGFGCVYPPHALERKYPNANRDWIRQYVFPAMKHSIDPRSGVEQRHHLNETVRQQSVREAVRGPVYKKGGVSYAVRLPPTFLNPVMTIELSRSS